MHWNVSCGSFWLPFLDHYKKNLFSVKYDVCVCYCRNEFIWWIYLHSLMVFQQCLVICGIHVFYPRTYVSVPFQFCVPFLPFVFRCRPYIFLDDFCAFPHVFFISFFVLLAFLGVSLIFLGILLALLGHLSVFYVVSIAFLAFPSSSFSFGLFLRSRCFSSAHFFVFFAFLVVHSLTHISFFSFTHFDLYSFQSKIHFQNNQLLVVLSSGCRCFTHPNVMTIWQFLLKYATKLVESIHFYKHDKPNYLILKEWLHIWFSGFALKYKIMLPAWCLCYLCGCHIKVRENN